MSGFLCHNSTRPEPFFTQINGPVQKSQHWPSTSMSLAFEFLVASVEPALVHFWLGPGMPGFICHNSTRPGPFFTSSNGPVQKSQHRPSTGISLAFQFLVAMVEPALVCFWLGIGVPQRSQARASNGPKSEPVMPV